MDKAEALCSGMPDEIRPHAVELAENVFFMEGKLVETRRGLANQQVVIAYDNGGGQKGIRENPAFKGYNTLLASYRKSLDMLINVLTQYGSLDMSESENPLAQILAEAEKVLADAAG